MCPPATMCKLPPETPPCHNQINGKKQFWRGGEAARRRRRIRIFPPGHSRRERVSATSRAFPFPPRSCWKTCCATKTGKRVSADDVDYVARGAGGAETKEISFMPARVLLQDFTGVPCVVDLAAMRDALAAMGADPSRANPLMPADLVIDHSVQVDQLRHERRLRLQRAARIPAQPRALHAAALGPDGVPQLPRGAARYRHRPPGEPGIPGVGGLPRATARPIPIRWSAPIPTPP